MRQPPWAGRLSPEYPLVTGLLHLPDLASPLKVTPGLP